MSTAVTVTGRVPRLNTTGLTWSGSPTRHNSRGINASTTTPAASAIASETRAWARPTVYPASVISAYVPRTRGHGGPPCGVGQTRFSNVLIRTRTGMDRSGSNGLKVERAARKAAGRESSAARASAPATSPRIRAQVVSMPSNSDRSALASGGAGARDASRCTASNRTPNGCSVPKACERCCDRPIAASSA